MKEKIYLLLVIGYFLLAPLALAQSPTPDEETATSPSRLEEIKERVQERISQIKEKSQKRAFWGTLKEITNSSLILETPRGERRVKTEAETKIFLAKKEIKITDLEIGNFLIVMGILEKNETLLARRILSLSQPPKPVTPRQAVYGKVTNISEEEKILVLSHPKKGTIFQVQVTNSTVITKKVEGKIKRVNFSAVEVGDRVVAVGTKEKTDGTLTAKIIHVIPGQAKGLEKITPTPTTTSLTPTPTP